ncbi:ribosomal protein mL50 [Acrasis kona]|uniref:Large ribosomal subunit protein mL50 n=1 Tax=Acrasis kona TaxID=1008807 RepID=A0AAW2ZGP2_9EUKA
MLRVVGRIANQQAVRHFSITPVVKSDSKPRNNDIFGPVDLSGYNLTPEKPHKKKKGNYYLYGRALSAVREKTRSNKGPNALINNDFMISKSSEQIHEALKKRILDIAKQNGVEGLEANIRQDENVRFQILMQCMKAVGRDIPNHALPEIKTVADLVKFYFDLVEEEKPVAIEALPPNLKMFLQHEKKIQRQHREQNAFPDLQQTRKKLIKDAIN